jgi:PrtD family type I secretion system ABC transporter
MPQNLAKNNQRTPLDAALSRLKPALIAVGVFSFFINILMLVSPLYMITVFQRVLTSGHSDTLLYLTLVAIFALLVMGALIAIRSWVLAYVGGWLGVAVGEQLLKGELRRKLSGQNPGESPLRDLGKLQSFLTSSGLTTLMDIPWVPLFVLVIFLLHPWLGIYSLVSVIVLMGFALLNELLVRDPQRSALRQQSQTQLYADQVGRNVEVVQALGMEDNLVQRWKVLNGGAAEEQYQAGARSSALVGFSRFLRLSVQTGILALGAGLVLSDGTFSAGQMIAASMLLGRALAPIDQAMGSWRSVIAARESYARLQALHYEMSSANSLMSLPAPEGNIDVAKMSFRQPEAEHEVLKDISFKLAAGSTLGIMGASAAGKSTLCRLLVGIWEPSAGTVRLDAAELSSWDRVSLGRHIGYLPQDIELFAGTVRENIARMGDASDEDVIAAAKLADVHEMVSHMPDGYNTDIGPGGCRLSAGQRQRIGIARAVFGEPRLLVLDEPNANLDRPGEIALLTTLEKLKQAGVTIIIVAHHPMVLNQVDYLMLMSGGKLDAFGPRDKVLEAMNAKLAQLQQAVKS